MLRDISKCDKRLQDAWRFAQSEWQRLNPTKPQVIITCTLRTNEEQEALFAQGRKPLVEINRLRKIAVLSPVGAEEGSKKVTNAKAGQSKHNPINGVSRAFDIGFVNISSGKNSSLNWDTKLFKEFAGILLAKFPLIVWGGNWTSLKDYPHFEV